MQFTHVNVIKNKIIELSDPYKSVYLPYFDFRFYDIKYKAQRTPWKYISGFSYYRFCNTSMIPCCQCTSQLLLAQWQITSRKEINIVDKTIGSVFILRSPMKKLIRLIKLSVMFSIWSAMKKYKPTDATTNPSLILQASQKPEYAKLIDDAVEHAKAKGGWVPCVCLSVGLCMCVCVCVCTCTPRPREGEYCVQGLFTGTLHCTKSGKIVY